MIEIKRFREWLIELKEKVNAIAPDILEIDSLALAVREGHMIRKLKDRQGIILCAKYPDCTTSGNIDNYSGDNDIVLFLLQKVASGQQTDETELTHYADLQQLMLILRDQLMNTFQACGGMQVTSDLTIEWEYDIFGGWNGLSIGFKLQDYD